MKGRQQNFGMKKTLLAIALLLSTAGVSHAMSELLSLSQQPVWPTSSKPDGSLVYNVTSVGRGGAGLLEVTLTAGAMPPGVVVTFSPSVLRFTGNQLTAQTATMTVSSPGGLMVPLDCYPFTITGTSQRQSITITNTVLYSLFDVANRLPTLYLDLLTGDGLRVRGLGASDATYDIQATTDVANPVWISLGPSTADANGRFTFFTNKLPGNSARFYRAVGKE